MDANHLRKLACALTHIQDATIDWAEFAKDRGITRKDNALRNFKIMIAKYGIEYSDNKFTVVDGFDYTTLGTNPSTPKLAKVKTPRKRKEKDDNEVADADAEQSPKKKTKAKSKDPEVHAAEVTESKYADVDDV
ncbi:hypothetical protein H2198_001521 [Neophaeococcomyces mojaviensis]|uniref:Uncharacterized protein n=1 Tax=Neophaeococcomyces mojaviensis TaxID=3383035 RepID=A0ACC3AGN7_9EURO|nr:hypothetical protein H2198_001521 [Knufia sp. JES_112]